MNASRVTVLMPVYNGERFLREAIDSILQQTFTDFELLIIDDGSEDESVAVIQEYYDSRIRLVHNGTNLGLVASLNKGFGLARGEYVARMDCDDVCLPERLALQVAFMEEHREIGICGTWVELIVEPSGQIWRCPTDPDTVKCSLLFGPVLVHPTVMIRRAFLNESRLLYDPLFKHAEDFDLWVRASEYTSIANIGKVLLRYRLHPQQVGQRHNEEQIISAGKIRIAQLYKLGVTPSAEEFNIHQSISLWRFESDTQFVENVEKWLRKLLDANIGSKAYPDLTFSEVLCERWFEVCDTMTQFGPQVLKQFLFSPLKCKVNIPWRRRVAFFLNCLMGRKRGNW